MKQQFLETVTSTFSTYTAPFSKILKDDFFFNLQVMICICTTASYGFTFLEAIEHNSQIMDKCIQFLADRNYELVLLAIQFSEMALRMQNINMQEENRTNIKLAIAQLKNHENKDIKQTASELHDLYFGNMQQSVSS